jgi:hypothetical protein
MGIPPIGIPPPIGADSLPAGAAAPPAGGLGADGGLGAGDLLPAATGVPELSPQPAQAKLNRTQTEVAINRRMGPPREKKLPRQ